MDKVVGKGGYWAKCCEKLDRKCVFRSFCIERLYENVLGQADFHLIQ